MSPFWRKISVALTVFILAAPALLLPLLVVYVGLSALAFGLVLAAMTTKYRDLRFAMPFMRSPPWGKGMSPGAADMPDAKPRRRIISQFYRYYTI